jgi:hypothetical protein
MTVCCIWEWERAIFLTRNPGLELYDLDRDPFEQRNLLDERRATAAAMTKRLHALARPHFTPDLKSLPEAAGRSRRPGRAARRAGLCVGANAARTSGV